MEKQKLKFVSYMYAIGTILVVLGHSTPTSTSDMPKIVDDIRGFIYCFHMPLFFFYSRLFLDIQRIRTKSHICLL